MTATLADIEKTVAFQNGANLFAGEFTDFSQR
jgi:hypothetical protein